MEQAQFGVLEMDWFIASLQPMRWIKVPGGRSRARRGRTLGEAVILSQPIASSIGFTKQPCQLLAGCHFLDDQRSVKACDLGPQSGRHSESCLSSIMGPESEYWVPLAQR